MELFDEIQEMFKYASWGKDFTQEEIKRLCEFLTRREVAAGEKVFSLGEKDFYLSYIIQGKVVIKKDYEGEEEKIIVTFSPNTFFGEISLVDGLPRSASAVAKGDTVIACLPKQAYEDILAQDPVLGVKLQTSIMKVLAKRLRFTTLEYIRRQ